MEVKKVREVTKLRIFLSHQFPYLPHLPHFPLTPPMTLSLDVTFQISKLSPRPKTEGTRTQSEISPSEEYSIGYSAPAW